MSGLFKGATCCIARTPVGAAEIAHDYAMRVRRDAVEFQHLFNGFDVGPRAEDIPMISHGGHVWDSPVACWVVTHINRC